MKKIRRVFLLTLSLVFAFALTACGSSSSSSDSKTITVGATSVPHAEILKGTVKAQLKKAGYTLKIKVFDDYKLPNEALDNGELDANYFQHTPYLKQEIKDNGYKISSVAKIHFEPLGIYSDSTTETNDKFSVDDIKDGAQIVVPDDATNEARALQLLASKGIITIKESAGLNATKADITSNPKNVDIVEVKANSTANKIGDADYVIVNGNYALSAKITGKLITSEDPNSEAAQTYANILVVQTKNKNSKKTKALKKALTSEKTKKFIEDTYKGTVVAVF